MEWTGTCAPFRKNCTVIDLLQEQKEARPEAIAIKDSRRSLTYRELDVASDRVAVELLRRGLQREEAVMIVLPASCEFLTAIVGVLKAGGTYFPVDGDIPAKRMEYLFQDSGSRFVLSDGRHLLPEHADRILDFRKILSHTGAETSGWSRPDPAQRAYITYTSGSTGKPKGVEIEHHALVNFVWNCHQRFKMSATDRSSLLAYVGFDASMADIWPVLCAGGTLVAPPRGILLDPERLIGWLAEEGITFTFIGTGLAEMLVTRQWPKGMKLKTLITGGDRLRTRPTVSLPFAFHNGYGPTENTVFSTWSEVRPHAEDSSVPPIGRPLLNTTAYILDLELKPVPPGEPGELYVGGEQVARGYLGRPELTRERFLPDPFSPRPGARMYRTGDWARWRPDGDIDFLGRKDDQIQIRGRRVELGEVEGTLFDNPAVRQVCCVPRMDGDMPSGIVAHIVPADGDGGLSDELRSYLSSRLPDYMIPAKFIFHEALPLTPQGKVNRAALIQSPSAIPPAPIAVAGETHLEQALARLWHSILPAAAASPPDATFLELGGDSLMAIRLMLGVEEITQLTVETSTFLAQPTFAGLCAMVKERQARTAFQPVLTLRRQGNRPPLFFLYGHTGDVEINIHLVEALGNDQPILGVRSPALQDGNHLPESIEAAAAQALKSIREIQPHGPPALAGYSLAGLLAFEIARQLKQSEGIDPFVGLLGTAAP
ncbi:MAG TPA: amino acid adenylation domain-containing protein, partial [Verrucomicrobiae bacterium]|nr:amino acid adenylation domain-containing protein [Verrucomicrobiae bacterium]